MTERVKKMKSVALDKEAQLKKEKWLRKRGWSQWYNPQYWVHPDSVEDPSHMDYTNYGMTIDDAIKYEKIGKPPHKFSALPYFSRLELAHRTKGLKANPDDKGK